MTATKSQLPTAPQVPAFDPLALRAQFPILQTTVRGTPPQPLVYLDNAATTQKPRAVIAAVEHYYLAENANIHRGVYQLSQTATRVYEQARQKVQHFIHARYAHECLFTRGTTESINLVANSFGAAFIRPGDEIIISQLEHHSNIVPWQMLCQRTHAVLKVIPINERGDLLLGAYRALLGPRTKLVAVNHVSNSLGTINPVAEIIALAHAVGAKVLIDGAQWVLHGMTDVQALDADFYAFSGHKMFAPTGIGVLYGKEELLNAMPPWQGGGDMIEQVTLRETTYAALPNKFEAGTPHISGAAGLGAAIDYIQQMDRAAAHAYEHELLSYATAALRGVRGLRIIGTAAQKAGVLSFVLEEPPLASLDIGMKLDTAGIAVRTGHHCCQPVMDFFQIPSTTRASLAPYNTREDVDVLVAGLRAIVAEATTRRAAPARVQPADSTNGEPAYPDAKGPSPDDVARELIDIFTFLPDWTERYGEIIAMGRDLMPLPRSERTERNRVHGCQSTVHISARKRPGTADVLDFLADSDADIVRGLIALLQQVFSGQHARDIIAFDVDGFFHQLGLDEHLSMGRRNGLQGMVKRIKGFATLLEQQVA